MITNTPLQIPDEVDDREIYQNLSFKQKGLVIDNCLYKIFELNSDRPEGITINELLKNLPFSKPAIIRSLTKLLGKREIYRINGKPIRYYKNGRVSHHIANSTIFLPHKRFDFRLFVNDFEKIYIFIQENNTSVLKDNEVSGGLILDADVYKEFVEQLSEKMELVEKEIVNFKDKLKELID